MGELEKAVEQWGAVQRALTEAFQKARRIPGDGGENVMLLIKAVGYAVDAWRDLDLKSVQAEEDTEAVARVRAAVDTVRAGLDETDVSFESGAKHALEEIRKALANEEDR